MASVNGIFSFSYMCFRALSARLRSLAARLAFDGVGRTFALRTKTGLVKENCLVETAAGNLTSDESEGRMLLQYNMGNRRQER